MPAQLESASFAPAGFLVDLVAILVALVGVALAGYSVYIQLEMQRASTASFICVYLHWPNQPKAFFIVTNDSLCLR